MTANIGPANFEEGAAGGITLFGRTLSTKTLGIILGVVGVLVAAYGTVNYTLPLFQELDSTRTQIDQKKQSIATKQQQVSSKGDLSQKVEAAKQRNQEVLALLPTADDMDTLLRDLYAQFPQTIVVSNSYTSLSLKGSLEEFRPSDPGGTPVTGTQFKTRTFALQFSATYQDAVKTIQNIERLKPLLVIRDVKLTPNSKLTLRGDKSLKPEVQKAIIDSLPPLLTVNFNLIAYVPLSEAELKAKEAAKEAAKPKK